MRIADFFTNGEALVGVLVRARLPQSRRDIKDALARAGAPDTGTFVGEFTRIHARGRRVMLVLRVGDSLLELLPQDAIELVDTPR